MRTFKKLADELSRRTADSEADDSLDLNIAQARHALRVLREIAWEYPEGVVEALGLQAYAIIETKSARKP